MMITIDLNNLTQAHIDEAAPHIRGCSYSSPCIIGALIPKDKRAAVDKPLPDSFGSATVEAVVHAGRIKLPEDQLEEAQDLQDAFDNGDLDTLIPLLEARGLKWPSA